MDEQVDRFFSNKCNKHSASELILGLLEQISEFLNRMEPRQKRKASRFGEQVGRAGWASRLEEQVDGFFSNKHSASELILGLFEQVGRAWASRLGEQVGRASWASRLGERKGPTQPLEAQKCRKGLEEGPRPRKAGKRPGSPEKARRGMFRAFFQAGLQNAEKAPVLSQIQKKSLKSRTKLRQNSGPAVLASNPKKTRSKFAQKSVKTPDLNPIQFL